MALLGPSLFNKGKKEMLKRKRERDRDRYRDRDREREKERERERGFTLLFNVYSRSPPSAIKGKTGNLEIVRKMRTSSSELFYFSHSGYTPSSMNLLFILFLHVQTVSSSTRLMLSCYCRT